MPQITQHLLQDSLLAAREKALVLFNEIQKRDLVQPSITELELSQAIYRLAEEQFGVKKFWHKRIVRSGANTICPYRENPPDLTIKPDDIVFFDFGPVFKDFEADIGRTFVVGDDPVKLKLQSDLITCFEEGKAFYAQNPHISGKALYETVQKIIENKGWKISNQGHCGHLIGEFPHERLLGEERLNYICPENDIPMDQPDKNNHPRYWILEIHMVSPDESFGGFYEDLLNA